MRNVDFVMKNADFVMRNMRRSLYKYSSNAIRNSLLNSTIATWTQRLKICRKRASLPSYLFV
ncbi:hypothetical protein HanRHA438_Chr10g0466451 [Helianthus annuus]|uniref:Uncharacterized protein n=1 Tax=Helianthus annuus TaxID=4232 RepID=A0A9K3HZE1_HELAN|nr:hypothetical protein HanXRQr2_Chr10g0453621 [Helianthus annuus]KAJ0523002.1 hypothetical protein HanIR_Chr10g0489001 [Helianthus annuus]KAJ0880725.1 hypothetical protein HanRHA438_Chr10g0466451 [Helianthus annuus]KAJ0884776.1 hypothetical protein HanPSC8_Chr10g0437791 [Helianthus annuus]